jgi:hypothetical protein
VVGTVPGGVRLFLGRGGGPLAPRVAGRTLTPPTFDPATGDVWTVKDQHQVVRVAAAGPQIGVDGGTALASAGPISALRLSPDGCRVAIVAGPPGNQSLLLGAVDRTNQATISQLAAVPGLPNVVGVSWQRSDSVLALTRGGSNDVSIHAIPFDGSSDTQVTTSGLPGPPSAVAASGDLPILAVAEGGVWELAGVTDTDWSSVARSGGQAGTAPTYPG